MEHSDITTEIKHQVLDHNLNVCLECGKCSAVCPMLDFYGEYAYQRSPRGVVERLSLAPDDIDDEEALWYCLTCQECTFFCPSGVDFQGFMMDLRDLLLRHGHRKYAVFCPVCGSYLMPKKEFEYLQKDPERAKGLGDLLAVCPRCKKSSYAELLHRMAPVHKKMKHI
ncbi:MAG: hypothetical protein QG552_3100 [Thermodesulfobacteriota bacterium]|nr:hypothetical protein [Thermodesulfobacteriota bacterium]